ncbi:hypothetical protein RJT34_28304 [Clitoria ternatea]|uniref:Protein kinase domain-containing protein n=1 Tax=Clitoria ternatea TaxID=43366 RepID=A0AAN9IBG2_CLITE
MGSSNEEGEWSTIIAIDCDRNSQHAAKWAVEHLLNKNSSSCTFIHVRTTTTAAAAAAVPKQGRPPTEQELHQFFLPFRGFCARKGIVAKELVLHNIDVPTALTDYILDNSIHNIVVGASRWNALIRRFKDADVATSLVRSLPESCMVHVVSKRKVQNIRPTARVAITASKSLKDILGPKANSRFQYLNRISFKYGNWQGSSNDGTQVTPRVINGETTSPKLSDESCSSQNSSDRGSLTADTPRSLGSQFIETSHENQDIFQNSNNCTYRSKSSRKSPKIVEMEIRKLKEQKRKAESTRVCKAASAKQKAVEGNLEKARLAEEVERQKIKAEKKSQKRMQTRIRAMHEEEERKKASDASAHNKIQFRRYDIREIEVATNYFDNDLQIGEGGYGPVYKGVLDDTTVAIKALRPDITQGEKQFQQEVNVLSTIRHPNMVQLLGACPEFGCLVYEYMENGSLEDRLFQKDNTPPIPWKIRFKIASEIATGLLFLHQTKPEPVVHRDLKPANILLDMNYVSKIADVGLARLVPPKLPDRSTQYHKTTAAGTFCYIDPEYQQTGLLGVKSDIYSLGVLLLQIITGKPPMGVAHLVEEAIQQGTLPEVLDPNVTDWPIEDTLSFSKLALKCCELRKRDRPDLCSVILPELNRLRNLGEAPIDNTNIVPTRQVSVTH